MLSNKYTEQQIRDALVRRDGAAVLLKDITQFFIDCQIPDCDTCKNLEESWILPYLKTEKSKLNLVMEQIEQVRQQAHREGYDHGYDVGHDVGYEDWYDKGYVEGHTAGYSAAADIYDQQYELYMRHYPHGAQMICGHSDPFWLIHRAASLMKVLSDMTPNISFEIWDRDGNIECRLDGETGQISFRGEEYLGDATYPSE